MADLIEALQIISKYENPKHPTHCSHDYLYVDVKWAQISKSDQSRLEVLGFFRDEEFGDGGIGSFRFGSC